MIEDGNHHSVAEHAAYGASGCAYASDWHMAAPAHEGD
jgi:hypothetical protein